MEEKEKTLTEIMRERHADFIEKHGHAPRFAEVMCQWKDCDDAPTCYTIKLDDINWENTEEDVDCEKVIWFADGIDGLCSINDDELSDFTITEMLDFFE
jgi:hypothetical protein